MTRIQPTRPMVENELRSMVQEMTNKQLAVVYGVKVSYITGYLWKHGITRQKPMTRRMCIKCSIVKDIGEFRIIKHGKYTYHRWDCLECENAYDKKYKVDNHDAILERNRVRANGDKVVRILLSLVKGRAKRKGLAFDLDLPFLQSKWTGRCELSGIPFEKIAHKRQHPLRPSIDRIDNNKGYTKDNVRIILWGLNLGINSYGFEVYHKIAKAVVGRQARLKTSHVLAREGIQMALGG